MKTTLLTTFTIFICSICFGQIIKQTQLEDASIEYLFSTDMFNKYASYPIEITHLGGNITKFKSNVKNSNQSGNVRFSDRDGNLLFEQELNNDLAFEYNTDLKEVLIEYQIAGYSPYIKLVNIEKLSILIVKLQAEPSDDIYILNSPTTIPYTTLEKIMQCVKTRKSISNHDFSSCEEEFNVEISIQ